MIGRISGILLEKNPPQVLLEVQGVGYEIDVPMSTFYNLPNVGERVSLFTHLLVREDAHLLYGFALEAERKAFRQLLKISGVGARTARARRWSLPTRISVARSPKIGALKPRAGGAASPGITRSESIAALTSLPSTTTEPPKRSSRWFSPTSTCSAVTRTS